MCNQEDHNGEESLGGRNLVGGELPGGDNIDATGLWHLTTLNKKSTNHKSQMLRALESLVRPLRLIVLPVIF